MRIIGNKMGWKIEKEQMHRTPAHCDINAAILLQSCAIILLQ